MTIAGIVLYNPDIDRLGQNITAIASQIDLLVLIDNGSHNIDLIKKITDNFEIKIVIIENGKNKGIAAALNQILYEAIENDAKWVLTLDQDSVCAPNLIGEYNRIINDHVGIVTCKIKDRNFTLSEDNLGNDFDFINSCITSASYVNIDAWKKVGGFDESMFIDGVDTDFCCSIIENNYKIVRTFKTYLSHEVGIASKTVYLLGRENVVFNHSPFRYYHIGRNLIYNGRKHSSLPGPYRRTLTALFRVLLIIFYESNKLNKSIALIRGVITGFNVSLPLKPRNKNYLLPK